MSSTRDPGSLVQRADGLYQRFKHTIHEGAKFLIVGLIGIGLGTLFRFWSYRKFVWVPEHVQLARLRRGRHRKGREPVPFSPPVANANAAKVSAAAGPPPGELNRRR